MAEPCADVLGRRQGGCTRQLVEGGAVRGAEATRIAKGQKADDCKDDEQNLSPQGPWWLVAAGRDQAG